MVLTSHKSRGITFKNDFTKLFTISRNETVLVYTCVVVNETCDKSVSN
jgi:hypothetical protein